ncbi:AraC family transcriptional regulator [Rhizobium sp. VS19-DR104.2]|uniref:helix-turn-helix domain-containing protein n=1 Tax=unclassified Rhizobium TaxID=2613769 RepID=UPI001ADD3EC6|nr:MULTISPECIES: AraC family transcriptional regulator [unclassified Rhizobium]MBO9100825.1 helix-turn-helix transcriptional regulator [Rhizobium sp. L58/93]MBZ5763314.1 AraC family transcriptional regulator [Rhizobium sp. VS19-DR96]MBZ5769182.1 AraC family transcriptional regulator [Rhizobium sp. VS19-DR129.2]MBZ5776755.1 AraC family transcriptional regulator [Rhizobium sp. VS19-DRK62.2]MBZ5787905.1 AraC family transcriptional regulator [Rhizobium sp. VS19-DR121]
MGIVPAVQPEKIKQSQAQVILHKQGRWSHARADVVRRIGLARQEIDVVTDHHLIFLNIRGAAKSGENYIDGRNVGFTPRQDGSLVYVPPGCRWSGWDEGDCEACYLMIIVASEFLSDLSARLPSAESLRPKLGFRDLPIQCLVRQIARELLNDDPITDLIVEGHLTAIFGLLQRGSRTSGKAHRGGLAPALLKRVIEKIDAYIERPPSVRLLAEEAGVTYEHFCRAFKYSQGITPYAFYNMRRLERASDLLRTTAMTVTEVALACGYASGSHLSTRFRRDTGISPEGYRAVWREPARSEPRIISIS